MPFPQKKNRGPLLLLIPKSQLKRCQIAKLRQNVTWPTYKLRREPVEVEEIERYGHGIAIWRDNGTLTYLSRVGSDALDLNASKKRLSFALSSTIDCTVVGKTDGIVAETAAYFWNLTYSEKSTSSLTIGSPSNRLDFSVIDSEQLAVFVRRNPQGGVSLNGVTLSIKQSVALATIADPIHLELLFTAQFEDDGFAFIDALESRQSSFGTLTLQNFSDNDQMCFDDTKLQRLFQIPIIQQLTVVGSLKDNVLPFVFASPIGRISWQLNRHWGEQLVHVRQEKVELFLSYSGDYPAESIFSSLFLLEHFSITHLVSGWIAAHPTLKFLKWFIKLQSVTVADGLFSLLGGATKLGSLQMERYQFVNDPGFSRMMQLLSQKRGIRLFSGSEEVLDTTKVATIYPAVMIKLLRLNRFYCGSSSLGQESHSFRMSAVAKILMQSASGSFQRSALLLSKHADALCEILQDHVASLGPIMTEATIFPEQKSRLQPKSRGRAKKKRGGNFRK